MPLQEIPRNLMDSDMEIYMDFKENSPYQEGVILETYQRPEKSQYSCMISLNRNFELTQTSFHPDTARLHQV